MEFDLQNSTDGLRWPYLFISEFNVNIERVCKSGHSPASFLAGVWLSAIQYVAGSEVIEDEVSRATPGTPYMVPNMELDLQNSTDRTVFLSLT